MQKSPCENYIAIITGKNLVKEENQALQLFVFKKVVNLNVADAQDNFTLVKRMIIKDRTDDYFTRICMEYHFKIVSGNKEPQILLFAK